MNSQESRPADSHEATETFGGVTPSIAPSPVQSPMTKAERGDLLKVARLRERVAKADAASHSARLKADVEVQLSAIYKIDDEAWRDVTAAAETAVTTAKAEIERRCDELGIPADFAPNLMLGWYGRGANAIPGRRAELRAAAFKKIDSAAADAVLAIARASADAQTAILADGLTSSTAVGYLDSLPTPEQLMPSVDVASLALGTGGDA